MLYCSIGRNETAGDEIIYTVAHCNKQCVKVREFEVIL
jgi:hypothetical protein